MYICGSETIINKCAVLFYIKEKDTIDTEDLIKQNFVNLEHIA